MNVHHHRREKLEFPANIPCTDENLPKRTVVGKFVVAQGVRKKCLVFHRPQKFVSVSRRTLLWSLSWSRQTQSLPSHVHFT